MANMLVMVPNHCSYLTRDQHLTNNVTLYSQHKHNKGVAKEANA